MILFQTWYNFDHATEDKNKVLVESMLHEERKHFPSPASGVQPQTVNHNQPKVSSLWTKEDVESLRKGIVCLTHFVHNCGKFIFYNYFVVGAALKQLGESGPDSGN